MGQRLYRVSLAQTMVLISAQVRDVDYVLPTRYVGPEALMNSSVF
jgi:hypothetical protein